MVQLLAILCAVARGAGEIVDEGVVAARLRETQSRAANVAVLTQNRPSEKLLRRVVADENLEWLRAGSPSEAPGALREAGLPCGVFLTRIGDPRPGPQWLLSEVGECARAAGPDVETRAIGERAGSPTVEPGPSPEFSSRDAARFRTARNVGIASYAVSMVAYGAALKTAATGTAFCSSLDGEWGGREPCGWGYQPVVDLLLVGATIPLTVTGIELLRLNHLRRANGFDPVGVGYVVLPGIALGLLSFAGLSVDDPGLSVVGVYGIPVACAAIGLIQNGMVPSAPTASVGLGMEGGVMVLRLGGTL